KVADVALVKADEVEMVPADAMGFAHARLADMWKSEAMVEFRKMVERAGPDALKALDEGFAPSPSSVDRVTVVVMKGESAPPPELPKVVPKGPPTKGGEPPPKGDIPFKGGLAPPPTPFGA